MVTSITTQTNYYGSLTFDTYEEWNLWIDLINEASTLEKHFPEKAEEKYKEAGEVLLLMAKQDVDADEYHPCLFAGMCFERNPETVARVVDTYLDVLNAFREYDREYLMPVRMHKNIEKTLMPFLYSTPKFLEASFAALQIYKKRTFGEFLTDQIFWISKLAKAPELQEVEEMKYVISYAFALRTVLEEILGPSHKATKLSNEYLETLSVTDSDSYDACLADLLAIYRADPDLSVAEMRSLFEENHIPG